MSDLCFETPVRMKIKSEKFKALRAGFVRMGLNSPDFLAERVTSDGKVIPHKSCLNLSADAPGAPIRGTLVDFDDLMLQRLRDHNIVLPSV